MKKAKGGTLYVTTYPCVLCSKIIVQMGIKRLVYNEEYKSPISDKLLQQVKIQLVKHSPIVSPIINLRN